MERLLLVCLGSAVGGGARYLVSTWALGAFGAAFPVGTLAVNLLGSLLIAGVVFAGIEAAALSDNARVALTAGVLGGFTTYSAFSFEVLAYLRDGAWATVAAYVTVMVVGGLAACWLGWVCARWLVGG